jgi:hypothetical protein
MSRSKITIYVVLTLLIALVFIGGAMTVMQSPAIMMADLNAWLGGTDAMVRFHLIRMDTNDLLAEQQRS